MKESHSKAHIVDQLLDHSPKFRLNPGQAAQNLSDIMEKIDEIEAQNSRRRWIKWAGIICSCAVALVLVFYSAAHDHFLSSLFLNEASKQGNSFDQDPLEPWEVSPIFQLNSEEGELAVDVIGAPHQFGLGIEEFSVDQQGNRVPFSYYYAKQGYKTPWYILRSHDEVQGKNIKVIARNYKEPDKEIELISDAEIYYNSMFQVGEARPFYEFHEEGVWKLTLFLEDEQLGDITVKVLPLQKPDPELERIRERMVDEIAAAFEINLDEYSYKHFNEMINRDEYEILLKDLFVEVQKEFSEPGDTLPYIYLHKTDMDGYIFAKKKEGNLVVYYLENNEGEWSILDRKAKVPE